ncbi:hypothetical protein [Xenorhabdus nematophila]
MGQPKNGHENKHIGNPGVLHKPVASIFSLATGFRYVQLTWEWSDILNLE